MLQLISEISRKVDTAHSDTLRASAAAVADWFDETEGSELKAKVLASVADLQKGLLERDTEVIAQALRLAALLLHCTNFPKEV